MKCNRMKCNLKSVWDINETINWDNRKSKIITEKLDESESQEYLKNWGNGPESARDTNETNK